MEKAINALMLKGWREGGREGGRVEGWVKIDIKCMRFHQKTGSLFLKIDQREKSTPDERQGSGNQSKEMEKKLLGKKMLCAGARE